MAELTRKERFERDLAEANILWRQHRYAEARAIYLRLCSSVPVKQEPESRGPVTTLNTYELIQRIDHLEEYVKELGGDLSEMED